MTKRETFWYSVAMLLMTLFGIAVLYPILLIALIVLLPVIGLGLLLVGIVAIIITGLIVPMERTTITNTVSGKWVYVSKKR